MNIQHSSRDDTWQTPLDILDRVRKVLGYIDLDPASSAEANVNVQARRFFTKEDDALTQTWDADTIFLNPPGGKIGNRSKTALFWDKLLDSNFTQAIFLAFSLEALQTTQSSKHSIGEYPFCVPKKRIRFMRGDSVGPAPSHSNVIVYIGFKPARFARVFSDLGVIVNFQ